ncbi:MULTISPECIES: hypothetical protein [Bacillus cereus group]|uniref:Uncharacterized protein n=1 Tax=Bacillus cereus TaxID=1396 RepID=A0A9X6VVC8_BACCE|nr:MULTISPECIES: hypothetical protein [Bacillus cereus group]PFF46111.1 hypothetical protein CN357_21945 [Bacillus cereus]PFQ36415.1 hypothetical protein COK33_16715 [Bacillus cereus]PGB17964.1 hypothetical protein COM09_04050 [Bacillus toyonensis]
MSKRVSSMQEKILAFAKNLVDNPDSYKHLSTVERQQLFAMSKLYELRNQADDEEVDSIGDAIYDITVDKQIYYQYKLLFKLLREFLGEKSLKDSLLKSSELLCLVKEKESEINNRIQLQVEHVDAMRKLVETFKQNEKQEIQE